MQAKNPTEMGLARFSIHFKSGWCRFSCWTQLGLYFSLGFWDSVGVKLNDLTTKRDLVAPHLLSAFCAILKALKAEERRRESQPYTTLPEKTVTCLTPPSTTSSLLSSGSNSLIPGVGISEQSPSQMQEPCLLATLALSCSHLSSPSEFPGMQHKTDCLCARETLRRLSHRAMHHSAVPTRNTGWRQHTVSDSRAPLSPSSSLPAAPLVTLPQPL